MFSNCKSLVNLNIIKFQINSIKSIEYMFNNCIKLKDLSLPNFNTLNLNISQTGLNTIFNGCSNMSIHLVKNMS